MSKISITKKIGKSEFTFWVDNEDFREAFATAAFYGQTPEKCGICDGDDVMLDSNRTQEGYLYVKVRCLNEKCRAAATLGVYKDNKGGFWKKFEKYEPKEESAPAEAPAEKKEEKKEGGEEEGYPF